MFHVRCRDCHRMVLSGVARLGDREADAMRAHVAKCRPNLADAFRNRDVRDTPASLGELLARFDVVTSENGT